MDIKPKQPTAKGPVETFTGDAWVDAIANGEEPSRVRVNLVRFSPGARSAWHSHAVARNVCNCFKQPPVAKRRCWSDTRRLPARRFTEEHRASRLDGACALQPLPSTSNFYVPAPLTVGRAAV
jgi:hypothetical protein